MATPEVANRAQLSSVLSSEFDKQAPQIHADPVDIGWTAETFSGSGSMLWSVGAGQLEEFWIVELSPVEMLVNVYIPLSTVSGTVSNVLFIRLPLNKTAAHRSDTCGRGFDNAAQVTLGVFIEKGSQRIAISRFDGANFTAGGVAVAFQIVVRTVAQA